MYGRVIYCLFWQILFAFQDPEAEVEEAGEQVENEATASGEQQQQQNQQVVTSPGQQRAASKGLPPQPPPKQKDLQQQQQQSTDNKNLVSTVNKDSSNKEGI